MRKPALGLRERSRRQEMTASRRRRFRCVLQRRAATMLRVLQRVGDAGPVLDDQDPRPHRASRYSIGRNPSIDR
jgi:hypothetical protein